MPIFLTSLFLVIFSMSLQGQWIFGGGLKLNSNNQFKGLAPHIKIGKDVAPRFDINVDFAYYIFSAADLSLDVDLHYRLFNIADQVLINPVAGINFTRIESIKNSLSLGVSVRIIDDLYTYYIEPKYILNDKQFVVGIGFIF